MSSDADWGTSPGPPLPSISLFAAAGFDDLFIGYPLWVDQAKGQRLLTLLENVDLTIGVDQPEGAHAIATHLGPLLERVNVLVEVGWATRVASSGSHAKTRKTIMLTGLFADRIFSAIEVEHGKPAPDLFLHAAAAMGVDPSRAAVIEDSVYGVQAGVAAGMTAYGFGGGLSPADALASAGGTVFDQMTELIEVLDHSPARIG